MEWCKKGLIFNPGETYDWMSSYAQVPRILDTGQFLRIYFATRSRPSPDGQYMSRIGFIDVEREAPSHIRLIHPEPVMQLGNLGSFDHFGTMPGAFVTRGEGEIWLYYTGWQRGVDVPYVTNIGLAVSTDGGITFQRKGKGPIMGLDIHDGYLINGPWVFYALGKWHMWYSSATDWIEHDNRPEVVYLVKHAVSDDGIKWGREDSTCIPTILEMECQNAPVVLQIGSQFFMWFCYRYAIDFRNAKRGYRLGLAVSTDLQTWRRCDNELGISLSEKGWDSEMMAYPSIYKIGSKTYLFYNGNNFGKDGFGYAELEI